MAEAPELSSTLRAASLRVTRPRLAVLVAVSEHPPAETDTVIRTTRVFLPEVSHQTVYDALNALTATGLVRRGICPRCATAREVSDRSPSPLDER